MKERLQKVLARSGHGSRRSAEDLIRTGRVTVNGRTVTALGTQVDTRSATVAVDGSEVTVSAHLNYIVLHKPRGYVTTSRDPQHRRTVMELLPEELARYVRPVGRLDRDTEGLLLFTNDGELAYRLAHPRYQIEKEYLAQIEGRPSSSALRSLREGIVIDGRRTAPAQAEIAKTPPYGYGQSAGCTWLRLVIHEGRKRQVRLMCRTVGHPVLTLVRTRIDGLRLGRLPKGDVRPLPPNEVARLRRVLSRTDDAIVRGHRI